MKKEEHEWHKLAYVSFSDIHVGITPARRPERVKIVQKMKKICVPTQALTARRFERYSRVILP